MTFATPLLASAWRYPPPRWAVRCEAWTGFDVEELVAAGVWPLPRRDDRRGCGAPLCPVCGPNWARKRAEKLTARLRAVETLKLGTASLTLTVDAVPKGQLGHQLHALREAWRGAKEGSPYLRIRDAYAVQGFLWGLHPAFRQGHWGGHLHVVVVAASVVGAHEAAFRLGDRYTARLEAAGIRVVAETVLVTPTWPAATTAGYLSDIWKPRDPNGVRHLLLAALNGDEPARAGYEELAHTLHGRSLTRGSGVLGRGGAE